MGITATGFPVPLAYKGSNIGALYCLTAVRSAIWRVSSLSGNGAGWAALQLAAIAEPALVRQLFGFTDAIRADGLGGSRNLEDAGRRAPGDATGPQV
jgi:hypothetical protein